MFPRKIESNAKFQAASKACAHLLVPAGAAPGAWRGVLATAVASREWSGRRSASKQLSPVRQTAVGARTAP